MVMPIRPASVPSATVIAVIFSSVSWSIRTQPLFPLLGPPNRFPCERARPHAEPPEPRPARCGGKDPTNFTERFCALEGDFIRVSAHNLV